MTTEQLYKALGLSVIRDCDGEWLGEFGDTQWEIGILSGASEDCAFIYAMQQLRNNIGTLM